MNGARRLCFCALQKPASDPARACDEGVRIRSSHPNSRAHHQLDRDPGIVAPPKQKGLTPAKLQQLWSTAVEIEPADAVGGQFEAAPPPIWGELLSTAPSSLALGFRVRVTNLAILSIRMDHDNVEEDSPPQASRRRYSLPKLGCLAIFACICFWFAPLWLGSRFPKTIAEDQRSHPYGVNRSFGYSVQKYRWQTNGFCVRIWAGSSLQMLFDVPSLELVSVRTQKWLAQDRAVLIELDYVYHDSGENSGELALLYDFERGELHSFGRASAWFVWPPENSRRRQATKEEFNDIVDRLKAQAAQEIK